MKRRDFLHALPAGLLANSVVSGFAHAQTQATAPAPKLAGKQLRFIVGYPAGGVADFAARTVADGFAQSTGATVIVENRAGAASNIATEFLAKQAGDSGIYGIFSNSTLSTNPFVPQLASKNVDPFKDIVPVAALMDMILVLAATNVMGVKTLDEFLAKARNKDKPIRIGLAGIGSPHHLAAVLLEKTAGLNAIMVPYKGGAPMIADAAGGHLDAVVTTIPVGGPMVAAGKLNWIGIVQPRTLSSLPGVASLVDAYKGSTVPSWIGAFAPASAPKALVAQMHTLFTDVVNSPAIAEKLRSNGLEPLNMSMAQTDKLIADEAKFMKQFLSELNLDFST
jgi:tripartite-type tricarboxylate transporter receptor subunit TctC